MGGDSIWRTSDAHQPTGLRGDRRALGGAALVAAKAEGQFQGQEGIHPSGVKKTEVRGKLASYSESDGGGSHFTLSEMPERVAAFIIPERSHDRMGRLLLAAAEKGWEVQVSYPSAENMRRGGTMVSISEIRIEGFNAR